VWPLPLRAVCHKEDNKSCRRFPLFPKVTHANCREIFQETESVLFSFVTESLCEYNVINLHVYLCVLSHQFRRRHYTPVQASGLIYSVPQLSVPLRN
jgi:hypothetical protein